MAKKEGDQQKEDKYASALDRAIQSAMGQGRVVGRDDDPAKTDFPALWDWMSRIYIGIDKVRTPAAISIRFGPEGILVSISDRDLGVSMDACCPHLGDVFKAIEAGLTAAIPPIKSWGKKEPKLRKRNIQ